MIVQLTRFVFFTGGVLGGYAVSRLGYWTDYFEGLPSEFVIIIFIILGASIGFVFGGMIGRELTLLYERVDERLSEVGISDLVLGSIGLVLGLLVAMLVTYPFRLLQPRPATVAVSSAVFALLGYGGLRAFMSKRVDFHRMFDRLVHPRGPEAPARAVRLLDTSAIIDGRFAELVQQGLVDGEVRVPRFVLAELHTLSDSADDLKRARGRRGLDLLDTLRNGDCAVEVFEADYPDLRDVDSKLVRMAKELDAQIVTVDFNLTKVARVAGARALNLNELAVSLRPHILPGEMLRLTVSREGKEADQGVGYLEDGTMVVVAGGRRVVGHEVDAEVTSVLQTSAGRMVFTRLKESA